MKYITLITCIFFTLLSYGQDKLIFKDSTEKTGLVVEINKATVKFVADDTKKKKSYNQNDIDKVIVVEDGKELEYIYAKVPTQGTVLLAKLSNGANGKAALYISEKYIYGTDYKDAGGFEKHNFGGSMVLYYAKRDNEEEYFDLNYDGAIVNKFKDRASKYLNDCPSLAERIKNKELGKFDLEEIFKIYDNECD